MKQIILIGLTAAISMSAFSAIDCRPFGQEVDQAQKVVSDFELSMAKLEADPKVINVWLRERNDTNGHPHFNGMVSLNHNGWGGFTFNPTLKRLSDYKRINSYGKYATFDPRRPWESEKRIGKVYRNLGYHAEISEYGFVKHIGDDRHIG